VGGCTVKGWLDYSTVVLKDSDGKMEVWLKNGYEG